MRRGFRFCGLIVVAVLAAAANTTLHAQETIHTRDAKNTPSKSARLSKQIKTRIAQLGVSSRRERVKAELELMRIGPVVLPLLPPPELTPNISAREAVRRIRVALERRKARESVQPSRVTLRGDLSLTAILKAVTAQTGNRLDASRLTERLRKKVLHIETRRATFWSVIGDLSRRVPFSYRTDTLAAGLILETGPRIPSKRKLSVDDRKAFRVAVRSAEIKPLLGDKTRRLLRIHWDLTAEPRLRPLFLKFAGTDLHADAGQKSLPSFDPEAKFELPFGEEGSGLSLRSDFLIPANRDLKTVRLRGKLFVLTAAGRESISFDRLKTAVGRAVRRGGVTVTLQKVVVGKESKIIVGKKSEGKYSLTVRVAVSYDAGGPAFESHRTWIFHNRVFLLQKEGQRISRKGGFKTALQDDGAVVVEYNFTLSKRTLTNTRFVYQAPTLLINVPVQFDISAIPVSSRIAPKPSTQRKPQ